MSKRMLIDARHTEETRVTIVKGNRVEEFDYESASRQQLKGNIYLARVTRVEPSLQAAFVEYGGNRHGFLAFSEIHPDYYQIPLQDREALMAELEANPYDEDEDADEDDSTASPRRGRRRRGRYTRGRTRNERPFGDDSQDSEEDGEISSIEASELETAITGETPPEVLEKSEPAPDTETKQDTATVEDPAETLKNIAESRAAVGPVLREDAPTATAETEAQSESRSQSHVATTDASADSENNSPDDTLSDSVFSGVTVREQDNPDRDRDTDEDTDEDEDDSSDEDEDEDDSPRLTPQELEEAHKRRRYLKALKRRYSIQEVIKKRQVLLIQVVKEERGNKGAALTTYLSLAGRYCVLMPNATHAGGISRKISSLADRKKLKSVINRLDVSPDMGLIIRTAGIQRTKTEIKRDYEYLLRLWNDIRDLTLQSVAPKLIYEEADLIKRTIRDLYTRDIDEVLVEGEAGYRSAKDFMKLLMPSHAKKVQHYKDRFPLFHRYQVEASLESMYQPIVQLKSGGYIVINPTEALISIDVNSGRSTKEHNIEETAVKTNIEATEEIARQLRLRDMAGLIVIDFIDMEERRNNQSVERRMKEALKFDRARIQVGRISSFGLLEMSRQRMRPNLLETSMETCPHCNGTGHVRSVEFAALSALRALEEEGIRARSARVTLQANPDVAVYILNKKRRQLVEMENRYQMIVDITARGDMSQSDIEISRQALEPGTLLPSDELVPLTVEASPILSEKIESERSQNSPPQEKPAEKSRNDDADSDDQSQRRRKRRRRRRGEREEDIQTRHSSLVEPGNSDDETQEASSSSDASEDRKDDKDTDDDSHSKNRRRRGRRGGRRRRGQSEFDTGAEKTETQDQNAPDLSEGESIASSREASHEVHDTAETNESAASEEKAEGRETGESHETNDRSRRRRRPRSSDRSSREAKVLPDQALIDPDADNDPRESKPRRRVRRVQPQPDASTKVKEESTPSQAQTESSPGSDLQAEIPSSAPKPAMTSSTEPVAEKTAAPATESRPADTDSPAPQTASTALASSSVTVAEKETADPEKPKKQGWWQRTFG